METYIGMVNALGETAPSKTMIYKWTGEFKRSLTSIEDDPRVGWTP